MATTPIELVAVGKVPPRDETLFAGAAPSVVEVFPGVFLIATIVRTKNQCVFELVLPTGTGSTAGGGGATPTPQNATLDAAVSTSSVGSSGSAALTTSPVSTSAQRRLSEADGVPRKRPTVAPAVVPVALKSAFRVPRVIQVVAEDEGVIETVALVREPLGSAFAAALEDPEKGTAQNPLRDPPTPLTPSVNHIHVHFFIGTSNGTVLIGNALRGTILAVAQFQYHHLFYSESRGSRSSTTATMTTAEEEAAASQTDDDLDATTKTPAKNQAVVKFVVRQRRAEHLWNPSLPYSLEGNAAFAHEVASPTSKKAAAALLASPTVGSRVAAIYVVHSGGKVVELTRTALDVFVRASADRLDGRRPHLILEWVPETSPSAFPVAGPASEFAAHVNGVFVLEPPSSYASVEKRTATGRAATSPSSSAAAGAEAVQFTIRDADVLTHMPDQSAMASSALLAPLDAQRRPTAALLVGGCCPLFSFYSLQPPSSRFSAAKAVKAVKTMVTGVARSLWMSRLGTTHPADRPPHLKKIAAPGVHPFLQADAKCASLQLDPSQQWAAFAIEGGGRIYVAEVHSGVVSCVLKGCRAAQFTWWWTSSPAGRPALLLVVYLPLRHAVEVYTARTWERLAAGHVPEGCVLLRPCGVPSERRSDGSGSESRSAFAGRSGAPAGSGCGGGALLMDPDGNVYEIQVRWTRPSASWNTSSFTPLAVSSQLYVTTGGAAPLAAARERDDEDPLLSASLLRGCRTPDEFLEVALQLPYPQPRLVQEPAASAESPQACAVVVHGGDGVRRYLKSLDGLCSTVQRRFAPSLAEIAVLPLPCAPAEALEGSRAALPQNTTAAQCLHYVRNHQLLVESYYRLLSCRRVVAGRYFDPVQWTSGLVTAELWKDNFSTVNSAAAINFVKQMEEQFALLLSSHPAEQSIFKKLFTPHLYQVMRKVAPASQDDAPAAGALADPSCLMPLSTFLRCFFCGTARPSFLRSAIEAAEDADGSVNYLGPLSDLVFGVLGLDSFFAQMPALVDLGCSDRDVALFTVTWIARQGGRSLTQLLGRSTIGVLAAALLTFSDDDFLFALDRVAIPFVSVDGDLAADMAAGSIAGLLWCCEIRAVLRPFSAAAVQQQQFVRRARQLLQLWSSLTKPTDGVNAAPADGAAEITGTDARIAFSLRLGSLEPPSPLATLAVASPTAATSGERANTTGDRRASPSPASAAAAALSVASFLPSYQVIGDAIEVYLQRNGISISLLDNFTVPRADADAEAVRNFPLFSTFVTSLGATEHVATRQPGGACDSPDVVESLPWIESQQWATERFRTEVTKPLERLWQQLSVPPTGEKSGLSTTLRAGGSLASKYGRASVYQSCLLLVAVSVLEHAIRPLTDVTFFFWENNAVPDANFFPFTGAPEGLTLSGSRTSRDYLQSVLKLATLVEGMLQQVVAPMGNADRVSLIQHISMAIAEDDALLFPLMPTFLRARLTIWMQVLAQAPHAPLRRAQRVRRLVDLVLFFTEASAMTMGGVALTQLQSQMSVSWSDLIGGTQRRDQLRLLPDVFITDTATPPPSSALSSQRSLAGSSLPPRSGGLALSAYAVEDEAPNSAPLNVVVAAAVLRRLLVAGRAIYAQQRGQLVSTPAPAPCMGLITEDTRQCLSRLARCLGLHESLPDMANIVLMDYEIKNLFPTAVVEQEMLLLSTKAAAPQLAMAVLQCMLVQVLQFVSTLRKACGQRGDKVALEAASERLRKLVDALSPESRAWLQQRETDMLAAAAPPATAPGGGGEAGKTSPQASTTRWSADASGGTAAVAVGALLWHSTWVGVTEFHDLRRLVFHVLGLPKVTPERKNFFQLLFTLSQWACEARLALPVSLQRIARELPLVVEQWEKLA